MLDTNPPANPAFADFNHVILWYCDGYSFAGNRDAPYVYTDPSTKANTTLYFRGKRVLDAVLDVLLTPQYGLAVATDVLVAGGSAGGLSTYVHADHIASRLPASATRVKAAPVSGFFLLHDDTTGTPFYPE